MNGGPYKNAQPFGDAIRRPCATRLNPENSRRCDWGRLIGFTNRSDCVTRRVAPPNDIKKKQRGHENTLALGRTLSATCNQMRADVINNFAKPIGRDPNIRVFRSRQSMAHDSAGGVRARVVGVCGRNAQMVLSARARWITLRVVETGRAVLASVLLVCISNARQWRQVISIDIRESQCELTRRRLANPYTPKTQRAA
jgi:hypothetical protein